MIPNSARNSYRKLLKLYRYRRVRRIVPSLRVSRHNYKITKLGSNDGGWAFVETDVLFNSKIISCGLGEDASFDIEFASRYKSKVIIIDPTPRSGSHNNGCVAS